MSSNTSSDWGFAQPDCRGAAALLFFMNDLARVVNQYLGDGRLSEEALADAQKAVDALLARYVEIRPRPRRSTAKRSGPWKPSNCPTARPPRTWRCACRRDWKA